jgi:hypothetical protein
LVLTWQSVASRFYAVERATDLGQSPFTTLPAIITGNPGTTSYLDTGATNAGPYFYRVLIPQSL